MSNQEVYYNSLMCFDNDAKGWTSQLKNWKNNKVTIYYNDYKDVVISENWFATTIAISYVARNTRYITYANGLQSNSQQLNYMTSTVAA